MRRQVLINANLVWWKARFLIATAVLVVSVGLGRNGLASDHGGGEHAAAAAHGGSGDSGGHGGGHGGEGHGAVAVEDDASSNGINLGDYRIRSHYAVHAQKSIVRFVLYAKTKPEALAAAKQLAAHHRNKVRDQVITATRMVPIAEFDDPQLTRFRRRIILRLRRTIPELSIEDVYISNFQLQVLSL